MKIIRVFTLLLIFLCFNFMACGQKDFITVKGNVTGDDVYEKVILLKDVDGTLITVDSTIINRKGDFVFKLKSSEPDFYLLKFEPNVQSYAYLVLHPKQTIEVEFHVGKDISYKSVKGSEDMELIQSTLKILDSTRKELELLQKEYETAENKKQVEDRFNQTLMSSQNRVKESLLKNKQLLSSAILVSALDFNQNFDLYQNIADELGKKYPNNTEVKKLIKKVNATVGILPGREAPEIELPDQNGQMIKLSSLRGKYVLVDFWASWCRPCRAENPNVVALYNKYNSKGFDIYSVSLDKDKAGWMNAIKTDGLVWGNHVSDLKQWQSVVVPLYGIEGIPFTVLIDKEGKVIAKGLRGETLKRKLAELMGE